MTRIQKIDRWQAVIDSIVADFRRLTAACEAARRAGCLDIDGPLHEASWRSFDTMLGHVDVQGWIAWHIWDNACGKKRGKASSGGPRAFRVVHTSRQLARLIVETEEASQPLTPSPQS